MTPIRTARWVAAVVVLAWAGTAAAELEVGGFRLLGDVELGGRAYLDRPAPTHRGKFEEYRDMSPGPFGALSLSLMRPDESYGLDFSGNRFGYEDQEFRLGAGRTGKWRFEIDWSQTPHVYSTTARLLATEPERGVFRLPGARPPLERHNDAPERHEISTRTDTGRMKLTLTPSPGLEISAGYSLTRRDGDRPMSMAFGGPGNNFYETLEPIEQTIHDFRAGITIARERWQFQAGYIASVFVNDMRWMRVDNPCFPGGAAPCSASDTAAGSPITGQHSLAPSNMAHTINLAGGVNLPLRTRVNASASYAVHLQNEEFLPHTINRSISNNDLNLPERSLHGQEHNIIALVSASSRPFQALPLTLSAKYRFHDMLDLTPELTFAGHVQNDKTLSGDDRRAGRFSYMRQNFDVDGRYRLLTPLAMTIGAGWERWDRNKHREVEDSDEFSGKAALDWTPLDWVLARVTYRPSFRRIAKYNTRAHHEHVVEEDAVTASQGQSFLLRKFDQGERDRQRVDALIQLMPIETLTVSPTFSYRYDDYIRSVLGLQQEESWSAGVDVSWSPVERVAFNVGYNHERNVQRMRSRSRPVVGSSALDFADFDWISNLADTIDTFSAGLRATLIPGKLDWLANGSFQYALGRVETNNPVEPTSSTAANNYTADAKPWPAFDDMLIRFDTSLRYHFLKSWTATLGYVYESFQKHDFRTDNIRPFMGVNGTFLGNDYRNYDAHIVGMSFSYRFGQ